jgi:hypothetical protein
MPADVHHIVGFVLTQTRWFRSGWCFRQDLRQLRPGYFGVGPMLTVLAHLHGFIFSIALTAAVALTCGAAFIFLFPPGMVPMLLEDIV